MDFRNARATELAGVYDVEINHPVHGWTPFTANPADKAARFDLADLLARIESGSILPFEPVAQADPLTRDLSPKQFKFLLALVPGLTDAWDALELLLFDVDRPTYAALVAERESSVFRLAETLALVNGFADQLAQVAPGVDISEQTIRDAWAVAANHKGLSA
jgi:hypothetical protein